MAKSYHRADQEPDQCTLHDCGAFFVVLGSQAMYDDFTRWHHGVLELEQESPQHGLHCPHAHTATATLHQFVQWCGNKTKVLTMRRSVRVELSTCHKVLIISRHKSVSPAVPFHGSFLENVNITLVFSVLALFKNCAQLIVPSHCTQSTVCTHVHIKLLLICLLAPSYYYHQI